MPQCTATSKRSGERCKRAASKGKTVCYMHGAGGGGKPGNKSARKHGGYETLLHSTLTDQERAAWETINTDITPQIDEQIKLLSIREFRLMSQIAELANSDLVEVQQTYAQGIDRNAETDLTTTVSEAALPMILKIEEALTRAQAQKARFIDLKHKLTQDDDNHEIDKLVAAIDASRERLPDQGDDA